MCYLPLVTRYLPGFKWLLYVPFYDVTSGAVDLDLNVCRTAVQTAVTPPPHPLSSLKYPKYEERTLSEAASAAGLVLHMQPAIFFIGFPFVFCVLTDKYIYDTKTRGRDALLFILL